MQLYSRIVANLLVISVETLANLLVKLTKLGKKVGKSAKEIASLYRLHKEGISDATFPLYAIYKLFNDTVPKLSNLWDRFDLERIAELPNWVFHEEELLELDKWVKKNWEYDDCYDDFWKTCFQSIMK